MEWIMGRNKSEGIRREERREIGWLGGKTLGETNGRGLNQDSARRQYWGELRASLRLAGIASKGRNLRPHDLHSFILENRPSLIFYRPGKKSRTCHPGSIGAWQSSMLKSRQKGGLSREVAHQDIWYDIWRWQSSFCPWTVAHLQVWVRVLWSKLSVHLIECRIVSDKLLLNIGLLSRIPELYPSTISEDETGIERHIQMLILRLWGDISNSGMIPEEPVFRKRPKAVQQCTGNEAIRSSSVRYYFYFINK